MEKDILLRPASFIHTISSSSKCKARFHNIVEFDDRLHSSHFNAQVITVPNLEELRVEKIRAILFQKAGDFSNESQHMVVMAEDWGTVVGVQFLPNIVRIRADIRCQPVVVVVECQLTDTISLN